MNVGGASPWTKVLDCLKGEKKGRCVAAFTSLLPEPPHQCDQSRYAPAAMMDVHPARCIHLAGWESEQTHPSLRGFCQVLCEK